MQDNLNTSGQAGNLKDAQSFFNSSLIFARALGLILSEGEGIVVDIVGDIKLGEDVKKVIVLNFENQVHIFKCEEDVVEGTPIRMETSPSEQKTEE